MAIRFQPPAAEPAVLATHRAFTGVRPSAHVSPSRFGKLVSAIEEDAEPALARIPGDVSLEVTLALPESEPLARHSRLASHLLLVVSRLGQQRRVAGAFVGSVHGEVSSLRVGPAIARSEDQAPTFRVRTTGSPEAPEWREQILTAYHGFEPRAEPAPTAALLDIAFVVSSLWNWTLLWKPTIDALDGLLGSPDPDGPTATRDGRPHWLGLHRTIDKRMGGDVLIEAWWSDGATTINLA